MSAIPEEVMYTLDRAPLRERTKEVFLSVKHATGVVKGQVKIGPLPSPEFRFANVRIDQSVVPKGKLGSYVYMYAGVTNQHAFEEAVAWIVEDDYFTPEGAYQAFGRDL